MSSDADVAKEKAAIAERREQQRLKLEEMKRIREAEELAKKVDSTQS